MAKQIIFLAFIIFFAALERTAADDANANVTAAAADLAPAAAAAGINITNADDLLSALKGAANGAPISTEGLLKNSTSATNQPQNSAAVVGAAASAGAVVAGGVVGALLFI